MIVKGIPSGDLECWCFNVTAEDYKRITGRDPEGWEARFPVDEYKYSLYPSDIFKAEDGKITTIYAESGITVPVVSEKKVGDYCPTCNYPVASCMCAKQRKALEDARPSEKRVCDHDWQPTASRIAVCTKCKAEAS